MASSSSFATLDEGAKSPGGPASPAPAGAAAHHGKSASHEPASPAAAAGGAGAKHAPGPAGDGKSSIAGSVFNLANAVRDEEEVDAGRCARGARGARY